MNCGGIPRSGAERPGLRPMQTARARLWSACQRTKFRLQDRAPRREASTAVAERKDAHGDQATTSHSHAGGGLDRPRRLSGRTSRRGYRALGLARPAQAVQAPEGCCQAPAAAPDPPQPQDDAEARLPQEGASVRSQSPVDVETKAVGP